MDMDSQEHDMLYYTNLLSQDAEFDPTYSRQSETSPMSLDDPPPLPSNNPTSIKKTIRGANFIIEEDKLLVSSWLNCSLDAVVGTYQKHSQLWEKIFEYFQQYKATTTEQTIKSLEHRWSVIQKATNKFCAYLAQVEGLNQSGMTGQDKFEKAKDMYQSIEKCNFQFEHCWKLLKDQPKWISRPTKDVLKKRKTMVPSPTPTTASSPMDSVIENEVIELDRPIGRKAEKRKRKAEDKQTEEIAQLRKMKYTLLEESRAQEKEYLRLKAEKMVYDKKVEDEKLRIEAEKTELAKKESDQRIMMMDVSGVPEIQRLYFEELQREIIMRRCHASDT